MCPLLGTSPVPTNVQLSSAPPARFGAGVGTVENVQFRKTNIAGVPRGKSKEGAEPSSLLAALPLRSEATNVPPTPLLNASAPLHKGAFKRRRAGCPHPAAGDRWSPLQPRLSSADVITHRRRGRTPGRPANVTYTTAAGGAMRMHSRRPLRPPGRLSQSEATHKTPMGSRGLQPPCGLLPTFVPYKSRSPLGETQFAIPQSAFG